MKITTTHQISQVQKEQILQLWNHEYPEKLAYKNMADFESYLEKLNEVKHFLLANNDEKIQGWAITFKEKMKHGLQLFFQKIFMVKVGEQKF